ncbi:MAG TPA: Nif3-like dinuclear metal center hexameric protein [Flavobacteriaceae bacterium]|nr:Nif3-like dinuclear metal center hexameric protein [Flavobacteriaceae bacterium]
MIVNDVLKILEQMAPLHYAEDFDNVGLLVGNREQELTGILVAHDTLETVVDEAVREKCNLIVSFHPIIFSGLKKLTGSNYVERAVIKAIQNNIAIYAVHTAYDNDWNGVNDIICDTLGLVNKKILIPQKGTIKKLITFVPKKEAEQLRNALFEAGAGSIGNYDHCSFNIEGTGSFRGNEDSNPTLGTRGVTHFEEEVQIGITFAAHLESKILKALFENHSYEEVAYEVTTLENTNQKIGMGMVADLPEPMDEKDFLHFVRQKMHCGGIRHSTFLGKKISRVAVLGGSGSFAIEQAKKAGANVFLTADLKYHDFYKAENQMVVADIGHFESEQFTKYKIVDFLTKKITNFAPALKIKISEVNTNPVKYL